MNFTKRFFLSGHLLYAYLPMEETDDAADEVLGDINTSLHHGASLTVGKTSRGLRLNGHPQYADLGRPRYESKFKCHDSTDQSVLTIIKWVGTFFAVYKNLNMQCNFNMHNIHILLFWFKPNIKGFIEDTTFIHGLSLLM